MSGCSNILVSYFHFLLYLIQCLTAPSLAWRVSGRCAPPAAARMAFRMAGAVGMVGVFRKSFGALRPQRMRDFKEDWGDVRGVRCFGQSHLARNCRSDSSPFPFDTAPRGRSPTPAWWHPCTCPATTAGLSTLPMSVTEMTCITLHLTGLDVDRHHSQPGC